MNSMDRQADIPAYVVKANLDDTRTAQRNGRERPKQPQPLPDRIAPNPREDRRVKATASSARFKVTGVLRSNFLDNSGVRGDQIDRATPAVNRRGSNESISFARPNLDRAEEPGMPNRDWKGFKWRQDLKNQFTARKRANVLKRRGVDDETTDLKQFARDYNAVGFIEPYHFEPKGKDATPSAERNVVVDAHGRIYNEKRKNDNPMELMTDDVVRGIDRIRGAVRRTRIDGKVNIYPYIDDLSDGKLGEKYEEIRRAEKVKARKPRETFPEFSFEPTAQFGATTEISTNEPEMTDDRPDEDPTGRAYVLDDDLAQIEEWRQWTEKGNGRVEALDDEAPATTPLWVSSGVAIEPGTEAYNEAAAGE